MLEEQAENGVADDPPPGAGTRVAGIAAAIAVTALVLWGAVHVVIPPVNPQRQAPSGHWSGPCWTCHLISEDAPIGKAK